MTIKKYRSKLEKVINENCELTYNTTVEDCQKWFNILNRELFDNSLPKVHEIDIRWRRGAHAWYDYDEDKPGTGISKLLMNKRYKSKQFFVAVLFHEMVHHYQYINNEKVGHGKSFVKWKNIALKYGLDFGITL